MTNISPWAVTALAVSSATAFSIATFSPSIQTTHAFAIRPPPSTTKHNRLVSPSALHMGKNRQGNPIQTLFGDMASSLFSSSSSGPSNPKALSTKLSALSTKSWDEITSTLHTQQTPTERTFRTNLSKGYGPPSPLHLTRLYSPTNTESDIRITLYRDSASWCPYCQKVWMTLEEKRIPYKVEKINMRCYGDKPSSFLRLQPNGNIPVAVIDGRVYNQSNDIMYALEQLFPDHKSLSPKDKDRAKANELLRLERQIFGAWMYWLTGGSGGGRNKDEFVATLEVVERELEGSKGGDFFLGEDVTMVDMMFAPFLERMCASLLFFKGFQIRVPPGTPTKYPAINKWFDAMEQLESYQLTKSDYYTHCWDLPPQLGGCTYEKGGEPYELAINGERTLDGTRGGWELPLEPHLGGIEPDWTWCGDEGAAKREAVDRLAANYENIVSFASRGAGRKGSPPVMAALSDPNAVPNGDVKKAVDAVLRVVSMALLDGTEGEVEQSMKSVAGVIVEEGGMEYADGVVSSLAYLRDRVGVPRDMRLPAARQLRAHLNWGIGKILEVQDKK